MTTLNRVLSFDIGIRNLAWCALDYDASGSTWQVAGWQNYDLIEGVGNDQKTKDTCHACKAKPRMYGRIEGRDFQACLKHCPSSRPAFRDLSGSVLTSLPGLKVMKEFLKGKGVAAVTSMTKDTVVEKLLDYVALPIQKKKKKSTEYDLSVIHDAIRTLVIRERPIFEKCKAILLENQPVLKNPTMKSVQMLLFATLRDCLQPAPPTIALVHAGKKVKGAETGDAGYAARKSGSEARVIEHLKKQNVVEKGRWLEVFEAQKKKSDLADAFCMCLDALKRV
jgi:hypothetical protein